jgi:hypothetical protein
MNLDFWRNVSIIWLALQLFIILVIPLAITYFAVRGMSFVLKKTPPVFHKAQEISGKVRATTDSAAERAVEPVIEANKKVTAAEVALRRLLRDTRSESK